MLLLSGGLPQPSPIKQPKASTCSLAPGRCVSRCAVGSSSSSSQAEHQEQQQQQRKTGRRRQQQQQQQKDAQPATRQQQQRAKPPASSSNTPGGGRKQGTHVRKPRKLAPTPAPLGAAPAAQALPAPPQAFPISTLKSPFFNVRFKTFQQLQHLTVVHGPSARIADITAMMSRLKHADWPSTADKAALLQALWQLLRPQLGHAAPRHCAEAMLTASKLGQEAPEGLYEDCMQQFVQQVDKAETRILSNAIYAAAIAPSGSVPAVSQRQVQDVLLPAFMRKVAEANSQSVANVAYALALQQQQQQQSSDSSANAARELFQQLLAAVKPALWADATAQELSNTIWAAGTLGAEPPHLQVLVSRALSAAEQSSAQDISNAMYGLTQLQQQLEPQQHALLAFALLQKQPDAQAISGFLWASAKMGLALQQQQVDALMAQLLQCGAQLVPQAISLALWGVATTECSVRQGPLLQLLQLLAVADASPQALGLSLWAAAKMKAELPTALLDQLYGQLAAVADQAEPQALSNALWAAAVALPQPYLPTALIGEGQQAAGRQQTQQQQQQRKGPQNQGGRKQGAKQRQQLQQAAALAAVVRKVPDMKPLELSNVALALALLGARRLDILRPVYESAIRCLDSSSTQPQQAAASGSGTVISSEGAGVVCGGGCSSEVESSAGSTLGPQALSNLCWAGAILGLYELEALLRRLAAAAAALWESGQFTGRVEEGVQLYQLHLWLTELAGTQGLQEELTPLQLQQCRDSMRALVTRTATSQLQLQVWEAAQQVDGLQDVRLEEVTADGLLSVDIAAVLDMQHLGTQQRVAIEVDGPWHWRRPDTQPTGPSVFRNRLLQCHGYLVVTVPFFEWQAIKEQGPAKVAYLQQAIAKAAGVRGLG